MSAMLFDVFFIEMVNMLESSEDDRASTDKLEQIGFRVGQALFESKSVVGSRFKEQLDVIKFICKEIWQVVFLKQIDNLRTNHKGTFRLQDNAFRAFSMMGNSPAEQAKAKIMLAFPCGIIRGGLASVGMHDVEIKGEVESMPTCKFDLEIRTST
eukprot:m.440789 g.440789  ORF g.440789 m.440789 type:complete len:155 (+) comp18565_c0_seq1:80-544(+)